MIATILILGIFAAIVLAAAMDPSNRRKPGTKWQDDTEYFGL